MPETVGYCFRTFVSEAEARSVESALTAEFGSRLSRPVTVGFSDFTERWCLYCHATDARALYVRSLQLAEVSTDGA